MAIKKIQMKPKGTGDYADVIHPETDSTMVLCNGGNIESTNALIPYVGITTNIGNAYTITLPTLITGLGFSLAINANSTGNVTLNGISILKASGLSVTNLKINSIYTLRYNGTNFILQGEGGSGNAIASDLLSGKTASTDAGDIIGTLNPNHVDNAKIWAGLTDSDPKVGVPAFLGSPLTMTYSLPDAVTTTKTLWIPNFPWAGKLFIQAHLSAFQPNQYMYIWGGSSVETATLISTTNTLPSETVLSGYQTTFTRSIVAGENLYLSASTTLILNASQYNRMLYVYLKVASISAQGWMYT